MSLFGFNKRFKHRKFDYIPQHYDADKEALEERLKKYSDEGIDKAELAKQRIRSRMKSKQSVDPAFKRTMRRRSNRILIYVILILILVVYWIVNSNRFVKFLEYFQ